MFIIHMKQFAYIVAALILAGCNERNNQGQSLIIPFNPVERTTISYETTSYEYIQFGKIGYDGLRCCEDTLSFPPIDGLVHKTAFAFCPKDTCYCDYAVLALRCPDNQALRNWIAGRVRRYVADWPISYYSDSDDYDVPSLPMKEFNSAEEISSCYMNWLQGELDNKECTQGEDSWHDYQQQGLLLADCWEAEDICTFYEIFYKMFESILFIILVKRLIYLN